MKLLISHTDLDGIGGIVVAKFYELTREPEFNRMIIADYNFPDIPETMSLLRESNEIVFSDLSCSKELLDELLLAGKRITIFDHHDSSLWLKEENHPNLTVVHDQTRSGTEILFQEYYEKKFPRNKSSIIQFVKLVGTYDLWKQDDPLWETALSLNRVLFRQFLWDKKGVEAAKPFIDRQLTKLIKESEFIFDASEKFIIQEELEKEDRYFDMAISSLKIRFDSKKKLFGATILPGKISIVASRILASEQYKNLDYLIVFNSYKGLNGKISARSRNGFDCTALCCFNGHTAAAGGEIAADRAVKFIENNIAFNYKDLQKDDSDIFVDIDKILS